MKNNIRRIFSGVKPSGNIHIGNYLGAIKQFVHLQHEADALFCVVDLHSITVPQDPEFLREKTLEVAMLYLATGIDPKKSIIFIQSHVPAHTELAWILNTMTPIGELQRMTQYKDAIAKGKPAFAGLLNYPVLMASDILLYQTDSVPAGKDQVQHIELARTTAERFNNRFGKTFTIPKEMLCGDTARIMGLDDPSKKMSKSAESKDNYIEMLEGPDEIRRKIKIAVTDSGTEIRYNPEKKPAISNLLSLFSSFTEKRIPDIEKAYHGKGYGEFKKDLAEVIIERLRPIQKEYGKLSGDKEAVLKILAEGARNASAVAEKTLADVKEKIGLLR